MAKEIASIELDSDLKLWLKWLSYEKQITLSEAFEEVLNLGRKVAESEMPPLNLSRDQKLLLQCTMESLLILKDTYVKEANERKALSERAKIAIRKTLGLIDEDECLSS